MTERRALSDSLVQRALGRRGRSKYGAVRVPFDGYVFDSKREARQYARLDLQRRGGLIRDLRVHPRYPLHCSGVQVATYIADFDYVQVVNGEVVIEDVKSPQTRALPSYRLKRRMVAAEYGVQITEVLT